MSPQEIIDTLEKTDERTRIAVVAWLFKHLVEHAQEGGTLRHLVYSRLKLPAAGYTPILNAGGMTVVANFELLGKREPTEETCRVPAEPTRAMWAAGADAYGNIHRGMGRTPQLHHDAVVGAIWPAMLKAGKLDHPTPLALHAADAGD